MSALRELLDLPPAELDWPDGLPAHLSASSLTMFARCREQFRERYVLGRKDPPKGYMLWGTADHRALDVNWAQKVESHEDIPVAEVQEAFAVALDDEVDRAGGESEVEWKADRDAASVKDRGVQLVATYHRHASPLVQPIALPEQRFELAIPGVPVPLIGYIDVEQEHVILDRKTKGRKVTGPGGQELMQGRIYQLHRPKPVHWHVSTKTKTPGIYTPVEEPGLEAGWSHAYDVETVTWVQHTVADIAADMARWGPDQPWAGAKARLDSPCGWCGYRAACPWWQS